MAIQQPHTVSELRIAIQELETKQANEWTPLKEQLLATAETLKPKNILKDTVGEIFSKPGLKSTAVNTTIGLAAVLAANFLFPTKAIGQLTKLVTGAIVGVSAMRKVVNNGSQIKSIGSGLLKRLTRKQPTL
ncbi:MAG: hypothetical protein IT250_17725 [Chitinophagaceae bacterium]|nr:hypothetical protein [Chitinophagaceae bacterium]